MHADDMSGFPEFATLAVTGLVGLCLFVISVSRSRIDARAKRGLWICFGAALLLAAPVAVLLVLWPFLALVAGAVLILQAGIWLRRSTDNAILCALAGVVWIACWRLETVLAVWSESVSGAIRLDIVMVAPFLAGAAAAPLWLGLYAGRAGRVPLS
ncbi:MAG: hypothetical protein ABI639_15340 [Thermoanaerobaculia bacterium]